MNDAMKKELLRLYEIEAKHIHEESFVPKEAIDLSQAHPAYITAMRSGDHDEKTGGWFAESKE